MKTVELPDELTRADLLAVARIHFPKLAEVYLELVVEKAIATERNFVSDIEKIATLARDSAQEGGRELPVLDDINSAIADVLPTISRQAASDLSARPADADSGTLQTRCNAPEKRFQGAKNTAVATRGNHRPDALTVAGGRINFDSEEGPAIAGLTG